MNGLRFGFVLAIGFSCIFFSVLTLISGSYSSGVLPIVMIVIGVLVVLTAIFYAIEAANTSV